MNTPPSYNPTSHRQRQSTSTKKKKRLTSTKIFPHLSGNFGSLLLKMFQEDLKVIHAVRLHTRSDLETHSSLQGGHLPGFPMKLGRHGMDRHERGEKKVCKKLGKNPELELSKKQCHVGIVGMCFFSFCWYRKATRFRDPKCWDNPHVVKYEHCFQTPSSWYCWKLVVCLSSCKNLWNSTLFQSEKPEQWSSEKNPESWNYWRFWTSNQIIRENSAKGTYFNLGCSPLPVVKVFSRFFRFGLDQNEKLKNSDLSLFQHPKTINSNASPSYSDF